MGLKGYIDGPDIETNWQTARKRVPIGETGEPIDVAQCILFLASDESRHVTGSELVVDGGLTAA
jgi:NAD(P)-dependent dehydrogenase (short-subunit alcohol dehydrogenase family)